MSSTAAPARPPKAIEIMRRLRCMTCQTPARWVEVFLPEDREEPVELHESWCAEHRPAQPGGGRIFHRIPR